MERTLFEIPQAEFSGWCQESFPVWWALQRKGGRKKQYISKYWFSCFFSGIQCQLMEFQTYLACEYQSCKKPCSKSIFIPGFYRTVSRNCIFSILSICNPAWAKVMYESQQIPVIHDCKMKFMIKMHIYLIVQKFASISR